MQAIIAALQHIRGARLEAALDESAESLRSRAEEYITDWAQREHNAESEFSERDACIPRSSPEPKLADALAESVLPWP